MFWCAHAAKSESLLEELHTALALEKRIVPVCGDETPMPGYLAQYQCLSMPYCELDMEIDEEMGLVKWNGIGGFWDMVDIEGYAEHLKIIVER